jgi:hypothetical protein
VDPIETQQPDYSSTVYSSLYGSEINEAEFERVLFSLSPVENKLEFLAETAKKMIKDDGLPYRRSKVTLLPELPDDETFRIEPHGYGTGKLRLLELHMWQNFELPPKHYGQLAKDIGREIVNFFGFGSPMESLFNPTDSSQVNDLFYYGWTRERDEHIEKEHMVKYHFPDIPPFLPETEPEYLWPCMPVGEITDELVLQRINDLALATYDGLLDLEERLCENPQYLSEQLGLLAPEQQSALGRGSCNEEGSLEYIESHPSTLRQRIMRKFGKKSGPVAPLGIKRVL